MYLGSTQDIQCFTTGVRKTQRGAGRPADRHCIRLVCFVSRSNKIYYSRLCFLLETIWFSSKSLLHFLAVMFYRNAGMALSHLDLSPPSPPEQDLLFICLTAADCLLLLMSLAPPRSGAPSIALPPLTHRPKIA